MRKMKIQQNLPVQVENMINNMLNDHENENARINYMNSLIKIRDAIDLSVRKFENKKGFRSNKKRS